MFSNFEQKNIEYEINNNMDVIIKINKLAPTKEEASIGQLIYIQKGTTNVSLENINANVSNSPTKLTKVKLGNWSQALIRNDTLRKNVE